MIARRNLLTAFLTVTASFLFTVNSASADDIVAHFEGTTQGNAGGQQVTQVVVKLIPSNRNVPIAIPNEEGKKGAPAAPKKDLADAVKKFKQDDVVKLSVEKTNLGVTLTGIEAYEAKPGEESKNGYVFNKTFEKSTGKVTTTTVMLTKYGQEYAFTVPTRKGEKGEVEQDPDILAAVGKLQEGNSVWVQALSNKLVIIEPYTDLQTGKLLKIGDTEIEGHKVTSADVEADGGKTLTLLVPVKQNGKTFTADSTLSSELHKVKIGSQFEFRVHEDGDKLWIREIEPAPKSTGKKPAPEKKPAAEKEMKKK